jgi:electron transfer flavoprotein beta subunit
MEIAVLMKQVPDSDEVKMDPERGTMIREGVGSIVNPLDLNALEAALALRERFGGRVTTLSMGPPQTEEALRETLALGADRAVLLSDRAFSGADSWATSVVLARGLEKLGPFDLILAGEKATDGETGQVGPEVASLLDLPCATYVSGLEPEEGSVRVRRTLEEGSLRQRLPLPCLLTVLNDLNETPMPTLSGKKRARRAEIRRMGLEDLGLDRESVGLTGSPTRVVRIERPKLSRRTEFYAGKTLDRGVERFVDLLRELALA